MLNDTKPVSQSLLVLILIWLGILSGAIITMLVLQRANVADLKSSLFSIPAVQYVLPGSTITKPGPDPWTPITINPITTNPITTPITTP